MYKTKKSKELASIYDRANEELLICDNLIARYEMKSQQARDDDGFCEVIRYNQYSAEMKRIRDILKRVVFDDKTITWRL